MIRPEMTTAATVDTSANAGFVEVKHRGLMHKKTTVSAAGCDIVTMPRSTAKAVGSGIACGLGCAAGLVAVGVAKEAAKTCINVGASAFNGGKSKLRTFRKGKGGKKYGEGGEN